MKKRITLEMWIREAVTDEEQENCTMLACVHMMNSVEKDEVHVVRFGGPKKWTPKELAKLFQSKADAFAQNIPGVQAFAMLAFYGGSEEAQAKHRFNVMGESEYGDSALGATEGPDGKGLLAQGMRHLEVSTQMMLKQMSTILDASNRTIMLLSDQNEKLMAENHEALTVVKEVVIGQQMNAHNHKMEQLSHIRSTEERKKWLAFAPALINSLLGREVFPQSTADTALVESVAEALSEEDIQKLAGSLPPALWGPMAQRFTGVLQQKRLSEQTAAQVIQTTNPEDDAAGD